MQIGKFLKNIYVKNLLIAVLIFLVLVFAILSWLKVYTQHGEAVEVPDVKGLQLEKAEAFFTSKDLFFQVIDSTFSKSAIPGSILETVPPIGAKVKKGRTIYLKINSFTAQLITVPDVKDLSQRQALAMLQSIGFERVTVKIVPGAYRDLAIGLESRGVPVEPGSKFSLDTPLSILVSSGTEEIVAPDVDSSVILEGSPDESWF
ncbi:PASTA domain-containing protein [Bacteroidia bacterium]|nr:PASTA domain-containing protein [Bacteroidia bacterium]GHV70194.1 PASTA domain-containing protein [Bacteroidia bacterium]